MSFRWGGKTWRSGNRKAFIKHLRSKGISFDSWAALHPEVAQETFRWKDPIDARIDAVLGPEIAAIQAERDERSRHNLAQQTRQKDVTLALAEMLKSVAPGVQNIYAQARDASAALGRGYAGATGDIMNQQAAADADFLSNVVGAPQAQIDQRNATAGGPGLGNVIYSLGEMPARDLNQAGAAWAAQSAQLPYYASQRGASVLSALYKAAADEDAKFGSDIRALRAKRPGLRLDLEDQRRKEIIDERRYQDQLDRQKAADARSEAALAAQLERLGISTNATMGLDAKGNPKPGYHIDPKSGQVVEDGWHHVKKDGVWIPVENQDNKGTHIDPVSGKRVKDGWHHVKQGGRWVPKKDKSPSTKDPTKEAEDDRKAAVKAREDAFKYAIQDIAEDAKELTKPGDNPQDPDTYLKRPPRARIQRVLVSKYMRILGRYAGKTGKGALRRRVSAIVKEALDVYYS